ncbi:conserved hypothetical protein [Mesorhizobium plurifarium]|uniref:DUF4365 domain-containing protein n=1 Tax=Mesorhizobium plurifarium TaxID=69974 RepID=A0A090EFV9_MESPL|nr:conserved hypothetical protein [Mesorhizobium plurifarium]
MSALDIMTVLCRCRFPLTDEKELQAAIAREFNDAGMDYGREHRLSERDVIDFRLGDVGVEVKIKGSKRSIYHQMERYAEHEVLKELVLISNVPMGFPPALNGKPVYFLNLAKAWL